MGRVVFGVEVKSSAEQFAAQGRSPLKTSISIENLQDVKDAEKALKTFNQLNVQLFRNVVFEIHKYLIRISPMHTGKFRGGWTALLDKFQKDYSRQIRDTSLYDAFKKGNKTPEHREYQINSAAMGEGKAFSSLEDKTPGGLEIIIENKAPYAAYLEYEKAVHFAERARYIGEFWMQKHFEEWLNAISAAGKIVPPPPVEEIPS